jgi:hypothetical protein
MDSTCWGDPLSWHSFLDTASDFLHGRRLLALPVPVFYLPITAFGQCAAGTVRRHKFCPCRSSHLFDGIILATESHRGSLTS